MQHVILKYSVAETSSFDRLSNDTGIKSQDTW